MKKILTFLILTIVAMSCQTYKFPSPVQNNEERLPGVYYFEDMEDSLELEMHLFEDGYFWEKAVFTDTGEILPDVGTYFYDPMKNEITFCYHSDTSEYNFKAILTSDFSSFTSHGETFFRQRTTENHSYSNKDIANNFELRYMYDDEQVVIVMDLDDEGNFTETVKYPDSSESYTDTGIYRLSAPSGCIYFAYYNWPEGNFYAKYDLASKRLYSMEGVFEVIDD